MQIDKKWVTEKQEKLPNHQTNKQIPVCQAKQTLRCQKLSSENKQAGKQINKCVTEKSLLHLHFGQEKKTEQIDKCEIENSIFADKQTIVCENIQVSC